MGSIIYAFMAFDVDFFSFTLGLDFGLTFYEIRAEITSNPSFK